MQDETFQIANGSYVNGIDVYGVADVRIRYLTKYDFANFVRERDFVGVYGERTGSWYIHASYEYQPGDQLSQTLTVSLPILGQSYLR